MNLSRDQVDEGLGGFELRDGDYVFAVDPSGEFTVGGWMHTPDQQQYFFYSDDQVSDLLTRPDANLARVGESVLRSWVATRKVPIAHVRFHSADEFSVLEFFCETCRCFVLPAGHQTRCARPDTAAAVADRYRRLAWLGDSLHLMDVRVALLNTGLASTDLDSTLQTYTKGRAQAEYLRSAVALGCVLPYPPLGSSDKQCSTAFEANYFGQFRRDYLSRIHGTTTPDYSPLVTDTGTLASLIGSPPHYTR